MLSTPHLTSNTPRSTTLEFDELLEFLEQLFSLLVTAPNEIVSEFTAPNSNRFAIQVDFEIRKKYFSLLEAKQKNCFPLIFQFFLIYPDLSRNLR